MTAPPDIQAEANFQIWFSYKHGGAGEGQVRIREHGSGWMGVRITASTLELWQSTGGGTSLDTDSATTDTDVWYEYYAECDGANVEVWRREKGTTDALVQVLSTSSAMTTGGYLTFASAAGNALDDIVILELDGDTVETETYAYNAGNELSSQVMNGVTLTYTYDQFGRMTKKTGGGKTADYYYHYGDKLTKVASNFGGEGTVTYTYGGDQKRRSRAVSGGDTIKYRYDQGWNVLNEENGSGVLEVTYIGGLATAVGSTAASGTWNYYFQDAIGSTRGLWDQDGVRIGKYEYAPFGGKYADHGEDITRKFTGHDWDSEARLYYTAYRYYSPDSNRWLTRDPLGMVDGPNVYAYVVNNPVSRWDALGKYYAAVGAAVGCAAGMALVAPIAYFLLSEIGDPCISDCVYNLLIVTGCLLGAKAGARAGRSYSDSIYKSRFGSANLRWIRPGPGKNDVMNRYMDFVYDTMQFRRWQAWDAQRSLSNIVVKSVDYISGASKSAFPKLALLCYANCHGPIVTDGRIQLAGASLLGNYSGGGCGK